MTSINVPVWEDEEDFAHVVDWRTIARKCAAYLIATKEWDVLEKWLGLYNGVPCWQRKDWGW